MKIGSLFSGIGGLELGLEQAGVGRVEWQVEFDPWCRTVLAKHWPNADRSVEDVRNAGRSTLAPVDIICGGFPCQDVSSAGKQAGLDGARSGLWYEYIRIVAELRPIGVVVENVASGKAKWLCEVRSGLQALGYRTRALEVAARDVGAPHLRRRVFVVALADGHGAGCQFERVRWLLNDERPTRRGDAHRRRCSNVADAVFARLEVAEQPAGRSASADRNHGGTGAQPGLGRDAHGLPSGLDGLAAIAGWASWPAGKGEEQLAHEPPRSVQVERGVRTSRRQRLKALGNAVVPQCAYVAGLALRQWLSTREATRAA